MHTLILVFIWQWHFYCIALTKSFHIKNSYMQEKVPTGIYLLTLKLLIITAAYDILIFFIFWEKKAWFFIWIMKNSLLSVSLIFSEKWLKNFRMCLRAVRFNPQSAYQMSQNKTVSIIYAYKEWQLFHSSRYGGIQIFFVCVFLHKLHIYSKVFIKILSQINEYPKPVIWWRKTSILFGCKIIWTKKMRKFYLQIFVPSRFRSDCADMQADQSLLGTNNAGSQEPKASIGGWQRPIRLNSCTGWSVFTEVTHPKVYFLMQQPIWSTAMPDMLSLLFAGLSI